MQNTRTTRLDRRRFLVMSAGAGAGLTLGVWLPGCGKQESPQEQPEAAPGKARGEIARDTTFTPNAFVRIDSDDSVTVICKHLEMGQGTYTGLATVVAEELDAAWPQVRVQAAPADPEVYNNLFWGRIQGTGGSTAMANSWDQLRNAGAAARAMLVAAAAQTWKVPEAEIRVSEGVLQHPASHRRARFGELAGLASQQPVPEEVHLKDPDAFRLIGTRLPRKDSPAKTHGTALYTQDVKLPGMLTAVVAHPPRFGARVRSFDATRASAVPGVEQVVQIPTGVAVLAEDFWSAKQGRDALSIAWDESDAFTQGTAEIVAAFRKLAEQPGRVARQEGDAGQALQNAPVKLEAVIEFPYLAHAAMEPLNCVLQRTADGVEIWNGDQSQTADQKAVAALFGLQPQQVKINTLYAGGSFGRRANPQSDYVVETAQIVRASGTRAPVKLQWTREDDMAAGYYRPLFVHKLQAGLDENGNPVAWQHRLVGQSIAVGSPFEGALIKDGVDVTSVEGASTIPYAIPNIQVELHSPSLPVPVQWWRSVGSSHTAFAVETFIDRLASAAGRDPVALRRSLLQDYPRHLGVLELAAEKSGWGLPMAANRGRGIAVHESFNSYVAQVAEVTVHEDHSFSVDRVVIAVDCGIAVNPDVVRAQMEGGMGFGLSPALFSEITLDAGKVVQSNFSDYQVLRIDRMPAVEVYIVPSAQPPTGVGEPATPVIAPAVANALSAATGRHFDRLPLSLSG